MTAIRHALRGVGYIAAYFVFGTLASGVAAIFGTFFVFILGMGLNGIVAVVAIPLIPFFGLPIGFALSTPVTFVVLPILALLMKHYPAASIVALSVSGAITGGWVTWWWVGLSPKLASVTQEFVTGGTAAGTIAGLIYAAMVRSVRT